MYKTYTFTNGAWQKYLQNKRTSFIYLTFKNKTSSKTYPEQPQRTCLRLAVIYRAW